MSLRYPIRARSYGNHSQSRLVFFMALQSMKLFVIRTFFPAIYVIDNCTVKNDGASSSGKVQT